MKVSPGHEKKICGKNREETEDNRIIKKGGGEISLNNVKKHSGYSASGALPTSYLVEKTGNRNRTIVGEEVITSPAHY